MPHFSKSSKDNLSTTDLRLQTVFNIVIERFDCKVLQGHRGEEEQNAAFHAVPQRSKLPWPEGKHNSLPSKAVDVAPYPIDWKNTKRFYFFAGYVIAVARSLGIELRWGGDWDSDTDLDDQNFNDLVHFEIRGE